MSKIDEGKRQRFLVNKVDGDDVENGSKTLDKSASRGGAAASSRTGAATAAVVARSNNNGNSSSSSSSSRCGTLHDGIDQQVVMRARFNED